MNKIFIYISFLCTMSINFAFAQNPNPCACRMQFIQSGKCCVQLLVEFNASCGNTAGFFNRIEIDAAAASSAQGEISSIYIQPDYSAFVQGSFNGSQGTISTSGNLVTANNIGNPDIIAEICFTAPQPAMGLSASIFNTINPNTPHGTIASDFTFNCSEPGYWSKIVGDSLENKPVKIKAFGDGVYVAGSRLIPTEGNRYFMSRYRLSDGQPEWTTFLDNDQWIITDFVRNERDEIMVIGHTPSPGNSVNSESFVAKLNAQDGVCLTSKVYNFSGRDIFEKIIRHRYPADVDNRFYILGKENPLSNAPSFVDEGFLINMDEDLNVNWITKHIHSSEMEARGLHDLSNGRLLIVGNGTSTNPGTLMLVEGNTGNTIQARFYDDLVAQQIDFYDALEVFDYQAGSASKIILVGNRFDIGQAFMLAVDGTSLTPTDGLLFPQLDNFKEIGRYSNPNGSFYTVAREKSTPLRNVLVEVNFNPQSGFFGTTSGVIFQQAGEQKWLCPTISVTERHNALFYADARVGNPNGFGDVDMMIGSFDLSLLSQNSDLCQTDFPLTTNSYTPTSTSITITNTPINEPTFGNRMICQPWFFACNDFCESEIIAECDFDFAVDCFSVTLTGSTIPPGNYTYSWDIDGDNIADLTGNPITHTYPSVNNSYVVTMFVIDASGNIVCTKTKTVRVLDINPPVINCPSDITLNTDPGECFASFDLPDPIVEDDCDDNPIVSYSISGPAPGVSTLFSKGITTVTCTATDAAGNTSSCTFTITVVDNEDPIILNCPGNIVVPSVPGCQRGANVDWTAPTVSDNCPMVNMTSSHQPGDFFECGTTTVTYTATDMAGNTSSCSFNITVPCFCGEVISTSIECNPLEENTQDFTVIVNSLSGANTPSQDCRATIFTNQSGITISNLNTVWSGSQVMLSGSIAITDPSDPSLSLCPFPNNISLFVRLDCICPDGGRLDCNIPVNLSPQCCQKIFIEPDSICKTEKEIIVPIIGYEDLCDIRQVRYYVSDAPCPPVGSWGIPFQTSPGYQDLILGPPYHNTDICVYAEIVVGSNGGPCEGVKLTDPVIIKLCEPFDCSIPAQEHCYFNSPITPAPLQISFNPTPDCDYEIQWFDPQGNAIPGETGMSYQPPALSMSSVSDDCYEDFVYKAIITSECGPVSCSANIRLYNDNSTDGFLQIIDPTSLPLCNGDDAILEYTPKCAGEPAEWSWNISTDGTNFNPINNAGSTNPLYYTNSLSQDTWYRIEKQNGVCPVDQIDVYLPVSPTLTITNFGAQAAQICDPTSVRTTVSWTPFGSDYPCDVRIDWYRNSTIIHSIISNTGQESFSWVPTDPQDIEGNYYVIISSTCCDEVVKSNVIVIEPPCEVVALGPCFRCNTETITLEGIVVNPNSNASSCSYQWYDENGAIPGANGLTLQVQPNQFGPFTFEMTCLINGVSCVKSDVFDLKQCGSNTTSIAEEDLLNTKIYPNPAYERIKVEFAETTKTSLRLELTDLKGKLIRVQKVQAGLDVSEFDLSNIAEGIYYLNVKEGTKLVWAERIMKQ